MQRVDRQPANTAPTAVLAILLVAAILAGTIFALLVGGNEGAMDYVVTALLIALGSLGFVRQVILTVLSRRERIDVFAPSVFFPILVSVAYGIGSIVYTRRLNVTLDRVQYLSYFLGLAAYYAGIALGYLLPVSTKKATTWARGRLKLAILGLFTIGILAYSIIVSRAGIPIFAGDVETARVGVVGAVGGVVTYFTGLLEIVIILVFVYLFTYLRSGTPFKYPVWTMVLLLAVVILLTLGARRRLALPLLAVLFIYHYGQRRLRLSLLIPLAAGVFLALMYAVAVRQGQSLAVDFSQLGNSIYTEIVRESSAFYQLRSVIPSQFDYFGWKTILMPFTALAPGQQQLLGLFLKEDILGRSFRGGGFVPGILAFFYIAFGIPGIMVGMLIMGIFITYLYRRMLQQKDPLSTALYAYMAVYYLIALRSGFIQLWPFFVLAIFLAIALFSRLRFASQPRGAADAGGRGAHA